MPKYSIYLFKVGYSVIEPYTVFDDGRIEFNTYSIFNKNIFIDYDEKRINEIEKENYIPIQINKSKSVEEIYYREIANDDPWWKKYWEMEEKFLLSSVEIVVLKEISGRLFASVHGNGRFLLNPISIEYDFGLRTALNLVDDKNISTAGLFTPSEIAMRTLKQAGKHTGINQYDINIYNSLLKNISGKVKKEYANYFKMIDGADTIRFSFSKPKEELFSIINELYNIYQKDSYKRTDLYWIDNFKLVRNRELIAKLDLKLVEAVKNSSDDVVLMFPEFLSSADYCAYSYSGINKISNTSVIFSALDIKDQIYDKIENKDEISIAKMKEWQINRIVYSNLETIRHYSIYQCLYYEQNENDKFYFIESGNWYSIEKEFSDIIEENYKRLFSNKMEFEFSYKNVGLDTKARADDVDNEYLFNLDLSNYLNNFGVAERLDRKMINYKKSTIELCDVLYKCDNSLFFIHNKYRHGSSSLSHLFSQGSVSAEAIVDKKFREAANKEIINDILKLPLDDKIKRDDIYIIYGIIAKKNSRNVFVLPIFSKINLMLFSEHIEKLGYNIRLSFFIQE